MPLDFLRNAAVLGIGFYALFEEPCQFVAGKRGHIVPVSGHKHSYALIQFRQPTNG